MTEDLKQVSLKEFLKIVEPKHEYRNLTDYIRLYMVKDNSEYFNRCFVLTHKDYETNIKTGIKNETITNMITISYWCELPFFRFSIDYDKSNLLGKKEVVILNLHSNNGENFISFLKLFELTKSDDIWFNYYLVNNSQNNEKTGLWKDTLVSYCRKYPKNGNKDAEITYRVSIDNEYFPGTMCALSSGYYSTTTKELFEQFNLKSNHSDNCVQIKEQSVIIEA